MCGQHGKGLRRAAMRDGNAEALRGRHGRSDPRNDLAGNARVLKCGKLLSAPSEDKRVAPLQSYGKRIFLRAFDQKRVDLLLRERVRARTFPDKDLFARFRDEAKRFLVQETVIDDASTRRKQLRGAQGERGQSAPRSHERNAVHDSSFARAKILSSPAYVIEQILPSFCAYRRVPSKYAPTPPVHPPPNRRCNLRSMSAACAALSS